MKKLALLGGAIASASAVFAQDATSGNIDLSVAEEAATEIATAIQGLLLGSVLDGVLLIVGASLAIWAVIKVVGWIRKGAK